MQTILLVEDDRDIADGLTKLFESAGFASIHAATRAEALEAVTARDFDVAVVDISLPDGNGYSICTEVKAHKGVPVIFLTASGDEASVVTGLNMGADDYVQKPFRPRELLARIHATLRKNSPSLSRVEVNGLVADLASGTVSKRGRDVALSALEYRLLLLFLTNPSNVLTRSRLLDELWDAAGEFVTDNTLSVYIKRLRDKIEDDSSRPTIILTIRGIGYRLGRNHAEK
ncbi:DNA-binding response OmpR family regulator [Salana multivorans]|uniref:DNA-binding response OmpR family regulator n=1 Tax=Salana multivorans TaxID=120377 RepID=A0A3N2D800_9MICO|nr:response regulator transcription factor [Salana multivorans]ROR95916.1 DNA-binding response OmpR family regulator [Salana multivorans]